MSVEEFMFIGVKSFVLMGFILFIRLLMNRAPAAFRHTLLFSGLVALTLMLVVRQRPLDTPAPNQAPPFVETLARPLSKPDALKPVYWVQSTPQAAPALSVSAATPFPWTTLLLMIYVGGALFQLVKLTLSLWGLRQLKGSSPSSEEPVFARPREGFATPRIRYCSGSITPQVVSWGSPTIYLPTEALGWTQDKIQTVTLHELIHHRRGDWWTMLFTRLVTIVYWFNPFVWLAKSMIAKDAEFACDDELLKMGLSPVNYATDLKDIASDIYATQRSHLSVPILVKTQLEKRIRRILDGRKQYHTVHIGLALALSYLVAIPLWPYLSFGGFVDSQLQKIERNSLDAKTLIQTAQLDRLKKAQISIPDCIEATGYSATLPGGSTVTLTAIAYSGRAPMPSWSPDGKSLAKFADEMQFSTMQGAEGPNSLQMQFAFTGVPITALEAQILVPTDQGKISYDSNRSSSISQHENGGSIIQTAYFPNPHSQDVYLRITGGKSRLISEVPLPAGWTASMDSLEFELNQGKYYLLDPHRREDRILISDKIQLNPGEVLVPRLKPEDQHGGSSLNEMQLFDGTPTGTGNLPFSSVKLYAENRTYVHFKNVSLAPSFPIHPKLAAGTVTHVPATHKSGVTIERLGLVSLGSFAGSLQPTGYTTPEGKIWKENPDKELAVQGYPTTLNAGELVRATVPGKGFDAQPVEVSVFDEAGNLLNSQRNSYTQDTGEGIRVGVVVPLMISRGSKELKVQISLLDGPWVNEQTVPTSISANGLMCTVLVQKGLANLSFQSMGSFAPHPQTQSGSTDDINIPFSLPASPREVKRIVLKMRDGSFVSSGYLAPLPMGFADMSTALNLQSIAYQDKRTVTQIIVQRAKLKVVDEYQQVVPRHE